MLNRRDLVIKAVTFNSPERVPLRHNITGAAVLKHGRALVDILARFPDDFGTDTSFSELVRRHEEDDQTDDDTEETDEWGCTWRKCQRGLFGQVVKRPLENWDALANYRLPPVPEPTPGHIERIRAVFDERKKSYYTFGASAWIWERMQLLRGDTKLMMDIMDRDPHVDELADLLFDHARRVYEVSLKAGCDAVHVGDDWGNQRQLRINPRLWRHFFKTRYENLFEYIHGFGADVRFHSCGHILEIIPDLIEIGIDILNVQASCMPLDALAELTRGKVCLEVDIDRQYQMPHGTPEDVRCRVQDCFRALALPEGGIIWLTEIGPDVPLDNVRALYEACHEFGG